MVVRDTVLQDVYLVEAIGSGFCKIGRTRNVTSRLQELEVNNPHGVKLLGIIKGGDKRIEDYLHYLFSYLWVKGEWFKLTEELTREFDLLTHKDYTEENTRKVM